MSVLCRDSPGTVDCLCSDISQTKVQTTSTAISSYTCNTRYTQLSGDIYVCCGEINTRDATYILKEFCESTGWVGNVRSNTLLAFWYNNRSQYPVTGGSYDRQYSLVGNKYIHCPFESSVVATFAYGAVGFYCKPGRSSTANSYDHVGCLANASIWWGGDTDSLTFSKMNYHARPSNAIGCTGMDAAIEGWVPEEPPPPVEEPQDPVIEDPVIEEPIEDDDVEDKGELPWYKQWWLYVVIALVVVAVVASITIVAIRKRKKSAQQVSKSTTNSLAKRRLFI